MRIAIRWGFWGSFYVMKRRRFLGLLAVSMIGLLMVGCTTGGSGGAGGDSATAEGTSVKEGEQIKIGFIVKTMGDSWFQQETKFAEEKAKELGAELVVYEAKDAEEVSDKLNALKTAGGQGVIICAPQTQLGAMILKQANEKGLKLMSVDDRLLGQDGKPLEEVPHLGISARNIGKLVGETIVAEATKRGWNMSQVHGVATIKPELETAMERVDGAREVLIGAGIPEANVHYVPWKTEDITGALDAANTVATQFPDAKYWVCFSSNDDGMMGAVRALENRGISADNIIGVGINGTTVMEEFKKDKMSGVFASVLLKPRVHGAQTVEMMVDWIKNGTKPELETYTSGTAIDRSNFREELQNEGIAVD